MQTRPLGTTGLSLPVLGFGASSLGQEFRNVTVDDGTGEIITALVARYLERRAICLHVTNPRV